MCTYTQLNKYPVSQYGWICPKCNNIYSPFVEQCYECNKKQPVNKTTYDIFMPDITNPPGEPIPTIKKSAYVWMNEGGTNENKNS